MPESETNSLVLRINNHKTASCRKGKIILLYVIPNTMKNSIITFAILILIAAFQTEAQELPVAFKTDTVFENISTVKVLGYFSKVNVKKSRDNKLRLEAILRAQDQKGYGIKPTITNRVLELRVLYPQDGWTSHIGELTLYLPDSVNIDIQTTSGYCNVYNISPRKMNISTKSGKININECNSNVLLASVSGDIFVDELTGSLNIKTKTGDIRILRATGDVTTHTTLGATRMATVNGNIKTESTSGKQEISDVTGDILANSVSGLIKISDAKGMIRVLGSKGDVQLYQTTGVLDIKTSKGNQTGTKITLTGNSKFTSTEGKIKMRFNKPENGIKYQLISEKGYLFAMGKSKKKKLTIGKGEILVEASSTTGTQSFF